MMNSTIDSALQEEAWREYLLIKRVRCPYLGGDVLFERDGFDHLFYKSSYTARSIKEQRSRAGALQKAVLILKRSGTLQEFTQRSMFVRLRQGSKWSKVLRLVRYCAFVAILDDRRYKVIVRKSGEGDWKFFSVFPLNKEGDADFSDEN